MHRPEPFPNGAIDKHTLMAYKLHRPRSFAGVWYTENLNPEFNSRINPFIHLDNYKNKLTKGKSGIYYKLQQF